MRTKLFTDSVLAQIARWAKRGVRPVEIAEKVGCTVGTLRVRCSHHGISLRQPSRSRRSRRNGPIQDATPTDITVTLPDETRVGLRERAGLLGVPEAELVSVLIETIDGDDLYSAVLDDRDEREERTGRRKPA